MSEGQTEARVSLNTNAPDLTISGGCRGFDSKASVTSRTGSAAGRQMIKKQQVKQREKIKEALQV